MAPGADTRNGFAVESLFPNWHDEQWVSHSLKHVLENMAGDEVRVGATVLAKAAHVRQGYVHPVMPPLLHRFLARRIKRPMNIVYWAARPRLARGDVAYFWLGSPAHMSRALRARGVMVAREMINCTLERRRAELRRAYQGMDLPDGSGIADADIARERDDLLSTDVVFCPNPQVKESVVAYGFPAERCIDTSYGWSERRLAGTTRAVPPDPEGGLTAAFVGTIDVRKGVPTLLEAWVRAGVKGRLLLAGRLHPEVETRYRETLRRPDVVSLGHVQDVGSVYRSADVFCFPSWEEGGPQVTLEAMSFGNVPIVSAMGTAGAFTAGEEIGLVVPPGDVEALAAALREMAGNPARRRLLSANARARAQRYAWEVVGKQRRAGLVAQRAEWLARAGATWPR